MKKELPEIKNIALVAHDSRKEALLNWCEKNQKILSKHNLFATGTTGKLLEKSGLKVEKFLSGPLGGDFQIGAAIVENNVNMLIFFWDPLESLGHDPDVKALLRIATLYNIPMACNETSAEFFIQSALMDKTYMRKLGLIERYNLSRRK